MKVVHKEILIDSGNFSKTQECTEFLKDITDAISKVVWPSKSEIFTINPKLKGNGVKPLKQAFQEYLKLRN